MCLRVQHGNEPTLYYVTFTCYNWLHLFSITNSFDLVYKWFTYLKNNSEIKVTAYAIMPNHVHVLASPHVPLPQLTKALKGYTAKRANQILALTGNPFWQEESYDHLVRNAAEGERIRLYIEQNPVRAGLVKEASQYRWSSAGWPTGRSAADQEVRPTF